jgi:hypothetical protein
MKSRDFCYWLQGFFELAEPVTLTPTRVQMIRNHLSMVFYHEIDPSFGGPKEQAVLNELHSGRHRCTTPPQLGGREDGQGNSSSGGTLLLKSGSEYRWGVDNGLSAVGELLPNRRPPSPENQAEC